MAIGGGKIGAMEVEYAYLKLPSRIAFFPAPCKLGKRKDQSDPTSKLRCLPNATNATSPNDGPAYVFLRDKYHATARSVWRQLSPWRKVPSRAHTSSSSGLSGGAIAFIVIGSIAGTVVIAALVYYGAGFLKRSSYESVPDVPMHGGI